MDKGGEKMERGYHSPTRGRILCNHSRWWSKCNSQENIFTRTRWHHTSHRIIHTETIQLQLLLSTTWDGNACLYAKHPLQLTCYYMLNGGVKLYNEK